MVFETYDQEGVKTQHKDVHAFLKALHELCERAQIKRTHVGATIISTIHLPVDSHWRFETMVIGGFLDCRITKWHNLKEAKDGHSKVVALVREYRRKGWG